MLYNEINQQNLHELVSKFYAKVRASEKLSKIFEEVVNGKWDEHITNITAFWSGVMLKTEGYNGSPGRAHLNIPNFDLKLFDEWLRLFNETARELFNEEIAFQFYGRSTFIAANLKDLLERKHSMENK